jgi:hypothetical protein
VVALVTRNENEAVMKPVVGSGEICVWQESKIGRSVLCSSFRGQYVITFSLVYKDFYKYYISNVICNY